MTENAELQEAECEALSSTFPHEDFLVLSHASSGELEGTFTALLRLPDAGLQVVGPADSDGQRPERRVTFLPPLTLTFRLPADYPGSAPPQFQLHAPWVDPSTQERLEEQLQRVCEENSGGFVLFALCMWLQDEAFGCLQLTDGRLEVSTLSSRPAVQAGVWRLFLDSEAEQEALAFRSGTHSCPVCASELPGSSFERFSACGHAFCRPCVLRAFEGLIAEGRVEAVRCLQCEASPPQYQLRALLPPEVFERYERLLLSRGLDTMSDVMPCPRQSCATPVLLDLEASMGQCPQCQLAFCIFCKKTYHGVNPCVVKDQDSLVQDYLNADSTKRFDFEKRYGKRNMDKMVEDFESDKYLKSNSMRCPSCKIAIEKIDGCNKMTCTKCGGYFCWLCNAPLNARNPYVHFASGSCANQLFLGVHDDWDPEDDFF